MIRENKKSRKVSHNEKWSLCNTITFFHILNMSAHAPLWHMSRRKVNDVSSKKEKYQFQVGCMSYPTLKQKRPFKEQAEKFFFAV